MKFWLVVAKYFDSGRVKVNIAPNRGGEQA